MCTCRVKKCLQNWLLTEEIRSGDCLNWHESCWHTCTRNAACMSVTAALYFKMLVVVGWGTHHHMYFICFVRLCKSPWHTDWTECMCWMELGFVVIVLWSNWKHCQIWSDRYTRDQTVIWACSSWVTPGRCFVISWSTYNWLTSQIKYLWELMILSPQFNCMISPYPDFPFRKYWHGFRFVCPPVKCCLLIDWW